jgi:hypothetical protein
MATFTVMMATKVWNTRLDNVQTFDLRLPVWPYYLIAWVGLAAAILLLIVRTFRLVFAPQRLAEKSPGEMVD